VTTPAAAIDDVWIKKWCEQNPTKHLIEAALCICMGSAPRISYGRGSPDNKQDEVAGDLTGPAKRLLAPPSYAANSLVVSGE